MDLESRVADILNRHQAAVAAERLHAQQIDAAIRALQLAIAKASTVAPTVAAYKAHVDYLRTRPVPERAAALRADIDALIRLHFPEGGPLDPPIQEA